jgi:RNA polymerase sigma-70 factor (ECF subfamily)
MLEDRLIIWEFNRGNRQVLRRAYEKYKEDLMTLAIALLHDKNAAEDVVQDVFVTLIKSAERFRLTRSLKGYLIACVANSARNRNKARQRHRTLGLDEAGPAVSESESPDFSATFGEQLHQLALALAQLPYQQRETVLLHLYSDMKFKAIAKLRGESVNTVKGRYRYGLKKLRSLLNSEMIK